MQIIARLLHVFDFNPRSREGSDYTDKHNGYMEYNFNPRSREGSDTVQPVSLKVSTHFNPRSREGSDPSARRTVASGLLFQSTLPRRERQQHFSRIQDQDLFQSTLPRRERRRSQAPAPKQYRISIHAPAKGATSNTKGCGVSTIRISIHAPAKGATKMGKYEYIGKRISIHAPAKGATYQKQRDKQIGGVFQSTLPRRERRLAFTQK